MLLDELKLAKSAAKLGERTEDIFVSDVLTGNEKVDPELGSLTI